MARIGFIGLGNMGLHMAAEPRQGRPHRERFRYCRGQPRGRQRRRHAGCNANDSPRGPTPSSPCCRSAATSWRSIQVACWRQLRKGTLFIDSSTIDVAAAAKAHQMADGRWHVERRRAGVRRRWRRRSGHAHVHGRRHGRSLRAKAKPIIEGWLARSSTAASRRRPGREDLQQHDHGDLHDRGCRGLRARRKTRPLASGACSMSSRPHRAAAGR